MSDEKYQLLIDWLKQDNSFYLSPNIQIIEDSYGGIGLACKGKKYLNEKLISIPEKYMINIKTVERHVHMQDELQKGDEKERTKPSQNIYHKILHEDKNIMPDEYSTNQLIILFMYVEMFILAEKSFFYPFLQTLPTFETFLCSVPYLPDLLRMKQYEFKNKVSYAFLKHSNTIKRRIMHDWNTIKHILLNLNHSLDDDANTSDKSRNTRIFQRFLHVSMLINSRCLYYDITEEKQDNFTLVPLVDFINHSVAVNGGHCYPKVNKLTRSFEIYSGSTTDFEGLNEVFFNYGAHSNDFLLSEYGFVVPNNPSDFIDITPRVLKLLNPIQIAFLSEIGYLGDYTVTYEDISFRTIVALALVSITANNVAITTEQKSKMIKLINGTFRERGGEQNHNNI
ncbi:uncharacterized protein SCODWIG_00059 [Saccharomycodes ludwigii]|uniref:Uncharacterized protein n=1 Tax=Saccharomycodes ludwigii TaxID=36035 RepID=A0A376B0U6_9ASCO|nr:uncharacterized protein SCODWIG_00059 [Saccharomycodes ludwigii]